ncbi:MAG: hypothetical protein P8130_12245 [Deltaproteobacteria bacterium]
MEQDISTILSYEIRKELADRYFGFRKLIEEDKESLQQKVRFEERTRLQKIAFVLVRIYLLLGDEELIGEFLNLSGLEEEIFYDPYFLESPTIRQKVFEGVTSRGLTRSGKFKHLLVDCYETLEREVAAYRQQYADLLDEQAMIHETIKLFYRKHDLSTIMDFLRKMDLSAGGATLPEWGGDAGGCATLSEKMQIHPLEPLDKMLLPLPPVTPLPRIREALRGLAEKAYSRSGKTFPLP